MRKITLFLCLIISFAHAQISPPYYNDFENGASGWYDSTLTGSSWELGTPNYGTTMGAHSGNNSWDVSLNSGYVNNTFCMLYSPYFNFSSVTNAALSFWGNYNSEIEWDATILQYTTDSGQIWKTLKKDWTDSSGYINWYKYDVFGNFGWWDSSNCWTLSSIKLDTVIGFSSVQFRFMFTSDPNITYDGFSIDDFSISIPQINDAAIASIDSPLLLSVQSNPQTVVVKVANLGSANLTTFDVSYKINAGLPITKTWSGLLKPNEADTFSMTGYNAPNGVYALCIYTSLSGDGNHSNDTLCCEMNFNTNSIYEKEPNPIRVFPNPSNKVITISNLLPQNNSHVQIINAFGKTVFEKKLSNQETCTIKTDFDKGIYFVKVYDDKNCWCEKLIVQ